MSQTIHKYNNESKLDIIKSNHHNTDKTNIYPKRLRSTFHKQNVSCTL